MQREMESTIYNLKSRLSEFEQNGKVSSLNEKSNLSLQSKFDDVKKELLQLRVSILLYWQSVLEIKALKGNLSSFIGWWVI